MRGIYFQGQIIREEKAFFLPLNRAFLYGESVFTSFKTSQGLFPFFPDHLERLYKSWFYLFPAFPRGKWGKFLNQLGQGMEELMSLFGRRGQDFYLKIILWPSLLPAGGGKGPLASLTQAKGKGEELEFLLLGEVVKADSSPGMTPSLTLKVSSWKKEKGNSPPSYLKMPHYWRPLQELRKRGNSGTTDILYVTPANFLAEASTSNIFVIKNGVVYTPSLRAPILDGVTRKNVIHCLKYSKIPVKVTEIPFAFLKGASEIFLTNAVRGVIPVKAILGGPLGRWEGKKKGDFNRDIREIHSNFLNYQLRFLYDGHGKKRTAGSLSSLS